MKGVKYKTKVIWWRRRCNIDIHSYWIIRMMNDHCVQFMSIIIPWGELTRNPNQPFSSVCTIEVCGPLWSPVKMNGWISIYNSRNRTVGITLIHYSSRGSPTHSNGTPIDGGPRIWLIPSEHQKMIAYRYIIRNKQHNYHTKTRIAMHAPLQQRVPRAL